MVLFVFLWSTFTHSVFGNPIVVEPTEDPVVRVIMLIIMFFIGVMVEYAYFNSKFFKKNRIEHVPKKRFLQINLVTFPLTQIYAYVVYLYFSQFFWFYVFLIEIGVIFIEWYLLKSRLQRVVDVEISSKLIFSRTLVANIFSFLIGLIAFSSVFMVYKAI